MNRHKSFAFKELLLSACAAFLIKRDCDPRDTRRAWLRLTVWRHGAVIRISGYNFLIESECCCKRTHIGDWRVANGEAELTHWTFLIKILINCNLWENWKLSQSERSETVAIMYQFMCPMAGISAVANLNWEIILLVSQQSLRRISSEHSSSSRNWDTEMTPIIVLVSYPP